MSNIIYPLGVDKKVGAAMVFPGWMDHWYAIY